MPSARRPATIDEYLAPLPAEQRAALQKVRKTVRAAVPGAEECISYGLPTFKIEGKAFFYFGAAARHCAIYGAVERDLQEDLADFETNGKGTIRFQPNRPLSAALVRKLNAARLHRLEGARPAARKMRTTSATVRKVR